MFSVHLNTTVCITSCAFVFGLKKTQQILGKYIVIIDAFFVAYYLFYEYLRTVSCSKHKTGIWSYFTI